MHELWWSDLWWFLIQWRIGNLSQVFKTLPACSDLNWFRLTHCLLRMRKLIWVNFIKIGFIRAAFHSISLSLQLISYSRSQYIWIPRLLSHEGHVSVSWANRASDAIYHVIVHGSCKFYIVIYFLFVLIILSISVGCWCLHHFLAENKHRILNFLLFV